MEFSWVEFSDHAGYNARYIYGHGRSEHWCRLCYRCGASDGHSMRLTAKDWTTGEVSLAEGEGHERAEYEQETVR